MPGLDERIERALRESARSSDADPGLVARGVERKKVRRQARRNAATGALVAAVLVTTAVVTVAIVRRDGGEDRRVATPPTTTAAQPADPVAAQEEIAAVLPGPEISPPEYLSDTEAVVDMESARGVRVEYVGGSWQLDPASACRIDAAIACGPPDVRVSDDVVALGPDAYAGASATSTEDVILSTSEYVRAPLVSTGEASWVAVYERNGETFTFPPSHLVDINSQQRIDLQGEILSFAEGEGASWAVTHDKIVDTDGTEYRLKRIDADGAIHSEPIPVGEVPAGRVAVGGGSVWVSVGDGALRFDLETGQYLDKVDPFTTEERGAVVVIDDTAWAIDGSMLRRLDRTTGAATTVLDTGLPGTITDVAVAVDGVWVLGNGTLARLNPQVAAVEVRTSLPLGLTQPSLASNGARALVRGLADLAGPGTTASAAVEPVLLLLGPSGVESTIVIAGGEDTAVTLEPSGELLYTSNGNLYSARLP